MVKPGGWRTRKGKDGRTEWIPPPHFDSGQARVNDYHHPENYLLPTTTSRRRTDGPAAVRCGFSTPRQRTRSWP
jgi:hypothetical protein